jgi:hypothetical protein
MFVVRPSSESPPVVAVIPIPLVRTDSASLVHLDETLSYTGRELSESWVDYQIADEIIQIDLANLPADLSVLNLQLEADNEYGSSLFNMTLSIFDPGTT